MDELNFTTSNNFLHHGIEGQKWGVRNGPPYPLDQGNANRIVQERKNKLEKYKEDKSKYGKIYNGNKAKRALKVGSATGASTFWALRYSGMDQTISNSLKNLLSKNKKITSYMIEHHKYLHQYINRKTVEIFVPVLAAVGAGAISNLKIQDTYANQGMQYKHAKENIKKAKKEVALAEKYVKLATKDNLTTEDLANLSIIKQELKLK